MTLGEIKDLLNAEVIFGDEYHMRMEIQTAFGADLLSDVLAFARPKCLLLTGLTNTVSLRTAFTLDIAASLIVRGKKTSTQYARIARELDIPVLATKYILFEASGRLYQNGVVGCLKEGYEKSRHSIYCQEDFEGSFSIQGNHFSEAGKAASEVKKVLRDKGLPEEAVRKASVVTFEAEVNIICYAEQGTIYYRVSPVTILVEAIDKGPGIEDIDRAMQEGYSTADARIRELGFGAGMGLANMKKISDVFQVVSDVGQGTHVKSIIKIQDPKSD